MSLSDRDRKILLGIVPVVAIVALWFLVFSPMRAESSKVGAQLSKAETSRDKAKAKADTVKSAKTDYAKDYETVVRLGKAIPSTVDTPSLIVQISKAAEGTHITFRKMKVGPRASSTPAPAAAAPTTGSGSSSSSGSGSGSGSSGSSSGSSGAPVPTSGPDAPSPTANKTSTNTQNASPGSTSGSTSGSSSSSGSTAAPAPATPGAAGATTTPSVPGLDTVPLEFGFDGGFFNLADFFHRMKRFVRVANQRLSVGGRLMTIDSVSFDSTSTFPTLTGEIKATVYLAPKDEGSTAGATANGPAAATPAAAPATPGTPAPASAPATTTGGAAK